MLLPFVPQHCQIYFVHIGFELISPFQWSLYAGRPQFFWIFCACIQKKLSFVFVCCVLFFLTVVLLNCDILSHFCFHSISDQSEISLPENELQALLLPIMFNLFEITSRALREESNRKFAKHRCVTLATQQMTVGNAK
jgi:hypothetical protein